MTDILLRMLCCVTIGLAVALLLRRPVRRVFGAGPAFAIWLLPIALAFAPLLPRHFAPASMVLLPELTTAPRTVAGMALQGGASDWKRVLFALWLAGAAMGLLRLAVQYIALRRGTRAAPDAWVCRLAVAAPNLDARRLRIHAAGPAVLWALPRALVLLPEDFCERFGDAATRELVLRHELTHVWRGDAWWNLVMEFSFALLWFHPLAWTARSRFRLDQELACDATSLRESPGHAARYARALIYSVAAHPVPALLPWLAEPQLKERIAMMTRIPPGTLRRRAGFVGIAVALAGAWYVAGASTPAAAARAGSGSAPPTVYSAYQSHKPPHFPADAVRRGEEGVVMLDVSINASGNATDVRVDQHGTNAAASLQVAAVYAARKWKFNPARKDGKPVAGMVRVPVRFSLNKTDKDEWSAKPCPADDIYDGASSKCVKLQGIPTSA